MAVNGWFPKLNRNGEVASGAGEIFVNGSALDVRSVPYGFGSKPQWIDDDTIVFNADFAGSPIINVRTGLRTAYHVSFNEMAAGGGLWMGQIQSTAPARRLSQGMGDGATWLHIRHNSATSSLTV